MMRLERNTGPNLTGCHGLEGVSRLGGSEASGLVRNLLEASDGD